MNNLCGCGCGKEVVYKNNRFISGHNMKISPNNKGKKFSSDHKLNLSTSLKGRTAWNKGQLFSEDTKQKMSLSKIGKPSNFLGHHMSEESKQKNRNNHLGKKQSKEARLKNSLSHIGKIFSEEHKRKLSESIIKYIEENGMDFVNEGKNEKTILNKIVVDCNIELLKNDRSIRKILKGKSADAYSPKYNLVIEVLENHHFKANNELSNNDLFRQNIIANILNCMIYYIPEQEFLKNQEQEIQRFKNFLLLLDEGIN